MGDHSRPGIPTRLAWGGLLLALLLATSCDGRGSAALAPPNGSPERHSDTPFGEPHPFGTFPAVPPFRYDRVDLGDAHAVVGVAADRTNGTDRGSVEVHARSTDGRWAPASVLRPPAGGFDAFGEHLALDGTVLGVTADRLDPTTGAREAVVLVYERDADDDWLLASILLDGEGVPPGSTTLTLAEDLLAIGTRPSFAASGGGGGDPSMGTLVRLFERTPGGADAWSERDPVAAPGRDDGRDGFFGADVELSPDGTLLAVADTAQTSDSGFGTYVFLYERAAEGGAWTPIRTFRDEELPSPYSAMLELDSDTLAVTPMAARETTRVEVAIFDRDAGGPNAWGRAAMVEVRLDLASDEILPRHVLLSADLAADVLAVGIGPSACIDLREEPGPDPAPCAGGRIHLVREDAAGEWDVRTVIDDPTGAEQSSYGEYVAMAPDGGTLLAGGTILSPEGTASTHLDVYETTCDLGDGRARVGGNPQ